MYKAMKIKKLKNYGIPSYILNIWEEHYSPYLLPLQEDAVRNYGILNCGENGIHPHPALSPQGRGNEIAALSLDSWGQASQLHIFCFRFTFCEVVKTPVPGSECD